MTVRVTALCVLLFSLLALPAAAAAYGAARPTLTASPDNRWLLRVVPGSFNFNPAGIESPVVPRAIIYQFDDAKKSYVEVATFPLRNKHAPKTAMISNGGEFVVTLDDWEPEVGRTDNAVVVYQGNGHLVRCWRLEEFLTPEDLHKANRPIINSLGRYWNNGRPNFGGAPDDRVLLIYPPEQRLEGVRYALDLRKLQFTPQPWRRSPPEEYWPPSTWK